MEPNHSFTRFTLLALSLLSGCAAAGDPTLAEGPHAGAAGAYLQGQFAVSQGNFDVAAREYNKALSTDPGSQALLQPAFLTSLLAGKPDAVALARQLPGNQVAQFLLAGEQARAGHWAQAEARYAAMPGGGLNQLLQPLLVAWSQQAQGHTDQALATLRPFIEGRSLQAVYTLHAALIADLGNQQAEAARLYRLAQTEYGGPNLELGRMVASWQARQGHPADALATLQSLVAGSPELAVALPGLQANMAQPVIRTAADGIAEAYFAISVALHQQHSGGLSDVLLRLALDMRPDLTAARLVTAELLDARSRADAGLAVLQDVPASDPLYPVVQVRRAVLTLHKGDTDGALRMVDDLSRQYPKQADIAAMQGDILRGQQRYPDAVAAYDHAVALTPHPRATDWPLFFDRGLCLDLLHQWPRAETDLQKALALSPKQPEVLNYLGYSWTERGQNLAQAHAMIEMAAGQRPDDGAIIDSLGWVELRQGNVAGAVRMLERATELEPEDATINGHLGDAYWTAGRKLEATYQWRRSLTLNPDPGDVPKLQAKLRNGDLALHAPPPAAQAAKTVQ